MFDLEGKKPNILVIGDLIIDQYLLGNCERISPEAPVQVINITNENFLLGGAGNVINNLNSLGASVDILSVIGTCEVSTLLIKLLDNINIGTHYLVKEENRITSKKSRIIASQQQVVRYDREDTNEISKKSQHQIITTFQSIVESYDVILLSDYGKGILTNQVTKSLIKIANDFNKKVLIDPKGFDYAKYKGAYLLTPNLKEASEATNIDINDDKSLKKAILKLKSICNLEISLITMSERGVAIYDDKFRIHPTTSREVYDVTGAGDTILASLGFALACKIDIDKAVKFSNLAAGVVVGKLGSATTSFNEVIEYESSLNQSSSNLHIKTVNEITNITKELKLKNKKIIFTNGCFDLLHAGHVKYLETAKKLGDILILGLNSDESVKLLKGEDRPINNQNDRAYILAALEAVDYVVIFNEETPYKLIQTIKPDFLVKGADYDGEKVIGEDIAGELILIDFVEGKSSSETIKKIKKGN